MLALRSASLAQVAAELDRAEKTQKIFLKFFAGSASFSRLISMGEIAARRRCGRSKKTNARETRPEGETECDAGMPRLADRSRKTGRARRHRDPSARRILDIRFRSPRCLRTQRANIREVSYLNT
jgi:hypothetical protein